MDEAGNHDFIEDQSISSENDVSMNVSGESGESGGSTDDDEEMMKIFHASTTTTKHVMDILLSETVEDVDESQRIWGEGSRVGRAPNKARNFDAAFDRLMLNYFSGDTSKYSEDDFERRFRMPRSVFYNIWNKIRGKGLFVEKEINFSGKKGIHPLVRLTACL
jgi:hypothetical protein